MSDLMLRGVILTPYEMAMRDDLSRLQFYSRAQALLADYDRMRDALTAMIKDMDMRARIRGDVENGVAVLDISDGVLEQARAALAQEGS